MVTWIAGLVVARTLSPTTLEFRDYRTATTTGFAVDLLCLFPVSCNAMPNSRAPAEIVVERLAQYLGPHTARVAVKSFSLRVLGLQVERITRADVPALLEALRPMLKTMIGTQRSEVLLRDLAKEIAP